MLLRWLTLVFVVHIVLTSDNSYIPITQNLIRYYVELITREMQRALTSVLPTSAHFYEPESPEIIDAGEYDFIIVGAGSAGAVIANRLTEVEEWSVLLIEAGDLETDFSDIPFMHIYLQGLEMNWGFNTTPQTTACLGMWNRSCHYPRGRVLGGTSSINGLAYVRGNPLDYDKWAALGNTGWSYEEVLPYFKKSENARIQDADEEYHGYGGYWFVENHRPNNAHTAAYIQANIERGRRVVDYNGREQLGVAEAQINNQYGRRCSTAKAFLRPIQHRENLEIWINSYVTQILIDRNKKAYGVRLANRGQYFEARARREVIVSAGSIQSPQLLMLSGVGPADHLKSVQIPVVKDLPVGQNLKDHATYFGLYFTSNYTEPVDTIENYLRQYFNEYGPYTIALNSQALGFYQSHLESTPGYPDIEFLVIPANSSTPMIQRALHVTDEVYDAVWGRVDPTTMMCIYIIVLHPKSVGTITLKSNDPYEYPDIDPRYLSDPYDHDIETMYQGILLALDLIDTNAYRARNMSLLYAAPPDCRGFPFSSRAFWYCAMRQLTSNLYHPISTCRMSPDPEEGVVDPRLRVHGIKNLRVADCSIIPHPVSGHTNAPAVMIGEKASDLIKEDNLPNYKSLINEKLYKRHFYDI
ncbi:glucose dehydrogenase [FAD, quinone]-like [Agrilus planipennis]|uniref:Glucose dehydrogenase [FAD, quinone]-like n=1 Tax=Agrilus planipennis TaxID=224129 RepID=A0A7F5RM71_AGRPL|nr:glucose dehydrogenase [FAD, quinone]-like [Agrilus planipennis]